MLLVSVYDSIVGLNRLFIITTTVVAVIVFYARAERPEDGPANLARFEHLSLPVRHREAHVA